MPPPVPPSVKLARMIIGRPISRSASRASSIVCTMRLLGTSRPILSIAFLNDSRSSALAMTSSLAPISSTPELLQNAAAGQIHRHVEARLAAQRRQQGVGPFLFDDLLDVLPGDRLDVRAVGRLRIGHDRRRVRIDQHDLVTVFPQRFARLGAGIVEFAGLTDDDRAGADDQNFVDVVATRHGVGFLDLESDEVRRTSSL